MTVRYIRCFDEIGMEDPPVAGGRNASLRELTRRPSGAVEARYGRPVDIGGAGDGTDGLQYPVQARPETCSAPRRLGHRPPVADLTRTDELAREPAHPGA